MIAPQIEADITFLPPDKSPRRGEVRDDVIGYFGCPFAFQSEMFECRMIFPDAGGSVALGSTARAQIQFLSPHLILPRLKQGDAFELWEMGTIAKGRITKMIKSEPADASNPFSASHAAC